jgi:hypothetical protein
MVDSKKNPVKPQNLNITGEDLPLSEKEDSFVPEFFTVSAKIW